MIMRMRNVLWTAVIAAVVVVGYDYVRARRA
jgi:hypothetical protein